MKPFTQFLFVIFSLFLTACDQSHPPENHIMTEQNILKPTWKTKVENALKQFGHRNWIVIADAAYPQQSNPSIETIVIDATQLEAVKYVSDLIEKAAHVEASILLDRELDYVAEENAKGVESYRTDLDQLLEGKPVTTLLHEDIIKQLDASAKLFNVLVLKTDLTIPYTSVFFELGCGYWPAESEQEMRVEMKKNTEQD